jgi:hypothetical protein
VACEHPRSATNARCLPARLPNHGGLTPAALGCVLASPRTLLDSRRTALAFPEHGGLTPAALVHKRLCIAKGVIFPANERRALRQERGGCVSPPWIQSTGERETREVIAWQSQTRFGKRRWADTRRSCRTCVCASRMSLFFSGPMSCTKSGWRKPAVGNHPVVRGERNHSTKTDRHCRCSCRTTAGSRPPLLMRRPLFAEHYSLHSASATCVKPRRAGASRLLIRRSVVAEHYSLRTASATRVKPRRADHAGFGGRFASC